MAKSSGSRGGGKGEVVEVPAGLPKRRVKNLVRAEIMLHKDAND